MARPTGRPVREELLNAARELIQTVGVGGFSYGDLAERVGIKAPSIHHYFRHKEDLVAEVAQRYREQFASQVEAIDGPSVTARLSAFADLFVATAAQDLMCLCGAVTAEWATAGEAPREQVEGFFDDQSAWLMQQIADGVNANELRSDLEPKATAHTILAALEGAILMSRAGTGDPALITNNLILGLLVASPSEIA